MGQALLECIQDMCKLKCTFVIQLWIKFKKNEGYWVCSNMNCENWDMWDVQEQCNYNKQILEYIAPWEHKDRELNSIKQGVASILNRTSNLKMENNQTLKRTLLSLAQ